MSNTNIITVIDSTGQDLFTCGIEEYEKAYQFAEEMERMDIEVTIKCPSLPETLVTSLGIPKKDLAKLQEMIDKEIEDHLPYNPPDLTKEQDKQSL